MDKLPNYMKITFDHIAKNGIKNGAIYDQYIAHDDWCNHLKGGVCNCNPDIRIFERSLK